MQKNKGTKVKPIFIWKTQKIVSIFNKFKKEMPKLVTFDKEDEMLVRLTLDNLFYEIATATEVLRRMKKK